MNAERIARRRERMDRINGCLKDHGFRVVHVIMTRAGKPSRRPYQLIGPAGQVCGHFEMPEPAHSKALRMLGK